MPRVAGTAGDGVEVVERDWSLVLGVLGRGSRGGLLDCWGGLDCWDVLDCAGDETGDASAPELFREAAGEAIANSRITIAMH